MRRSLRTVGLLSGAVLFSNLLFSQVADRSAYAITDATGQNANWSFLRKLDLNTGQYSQVLLDGNDINIVAYDAASRKQFSSPVQDARYGQLANAAFGTGVAAAAYDKAHNRLYYTPMFIDQLRYVDLKSMKVYYLTDDAFTGKAQKSADQGNIVTRMVIAADGNGYAITNDGMQLMRFSTNKKMQVEDLGQLVDDQANKGVSIHNSCSSYGGDVVADDDGNIYIFSARNHAFKVNLETRVATHLGSVTGLPEGYTINGAAVNEDNRVVVSSAVQSSALYLVDIKSLKATALTGAAIWHSSDLANSNLIASGNKPKNTNTDLISRNNPIDVIGNNKVSVYPNPVTNNQFTVQFNSLDAGNYTIQVTDVMGRQVSQQSVSLISDNQLQQVKIAPSTARGVYLVKVADAAGKMVSSIKIVVQ